MTVAEILEGVRLSGPLDGGLARRDVTGLEHDSRRIGSGNLFFAFLGEKFDGRQFAAQAITDGAVAVVCEAEPLEGFDGPWIRVEHGRQALATSARNFYHDAIERVSLTGITGTNGKTTTAYLTDSIVRAAGHTTALVGTIEYRLAGQVRGAINTTPESLEVYRIADELAAAGGSHLTMEVSSHALAQGRVHGVPFHTAVFSNLSRDHLDYHGTLEKYFDAKSLLFRGTDLPAPRYAVLNHDDEWARQIPVAAETKVIWYGRGRAADVRAERVRSDFSGVRFEAVWEGEHREIASSMVGGINVSNILAALATGVSYGFGADDLVRGIEQCRATPGRFEQIAEGQPFLVIVDYAHTDDAIRNVVAAARHLRPKRLITLFGCGGDRDRNKRPLMGEAAAAGSDIVVLTSDNPRSEDPVAIMNDALVGLRRHEVELHLEPDRRRAIQIALSAANEGDIVLLLGKGHESVQVVGDKKIPFDDARVAREMLRGFGYEEAKS